jgi:hypothetical protein
VLTDELNESYHVKKFSMIAERLRGATRVVNVSFIEPYCYVVVSQKVALRNFKAHDPAAKMMRGPAKSSAPSDRHD